MKTQNITEILLIKILFIIWCKLGKNDEITDYCVISTQFTITPQIIVQMI